MEFEKMDRVEWLFLNCMRIIIELFDVAGIATLASAMHVVCCLE